MAGSAIDASKGGKGSQADNTKFRFGRSEDRGRAVTVFPLDSAGRNFAPTRFVYDYTRQQYEDKKFTSVRSSLLNTTRKALLLDGGTYDGTGKGTKSGAKDWRLKVCSAVSSKVQSKVGVRPTGSPALFTYYSIPVPNWCTIWLFAHSVYLALRNQVNIYDGTGDLLVGQIVSFISPSGRSYSYQGMEAYRKLNSPPTQESAIDTSV